MTAQSASVKLWVRYIPEDKVPSGVRRTLKDLLSKYEGRVKVAFRDFPIRTLHAQAQNSAEAGRCAGEEGKFCEYHDALFARRTKLDEAELEATQYPAANQ